MSEPPPRPTHPGARMVGEAYKDHSDRAFGMLRAAEVDLAAARAELLRRAELCHLYAEHIAAVRAVLGIAEGADASGSESADVHKIQQLQDDLGMEMGMRTAAIDQLETLRRHLWALVDGDQLSDDDTVDRLREALAGRALSADSAELAAAERWGRDAMVRAVPHHLVTLLAEYDRRGAELARYRDAIRPRTDPSLPQRRDDPEEIQARIAALAARTPQPARGPVRVGDPDPTPEHADETCEETCHPVGSCSFGAGHDGDHVAGDGQRVVGVAPASAPQPAVPDGEDRCSTCAHRRWSHRAWPSGDPSDLSCKVNKDGSANGPGLPDDPCLCETFALLVDGEDVPARLGAAADALDEVAAERRRQDSKWGEQNHPDGTGTPAASALAEYLRAACDAEHAAGEGTWASILAEEVGEAFAESDPGALRTELIQVAAVAVNWVGAIDRRAAVAAALAGSTGHQP